MISFERRRLGLTETNKDTREVKKLFLYNRLDGGLTYYLVPCGEEYVGRYLICVGRLSTIYLVGRER